MSERQTLRRVLSLIYLTSSDLISDKANWVMYEATQIYVAETNHISLISDETRNV